MIEPQSLEAYVELLADLLAAGLLGEKPGLAIQGAEVDLGGKHEGVALAFGKDGAEHFLVSSVLVAMRGVEQEDAAVQRGANQVGVVGVHHAHADNGHRDTGSAERAARRPSVLGNRCRLCYGRGFGRRRCPGREHFRCRAPRHGRAPSGQRAGSKATRAESQEIPSFQLIGLVHVGHELYQVGQQGLVVVVDGASHPGRRGAAQVGLRLHAPISRKLPGHCQVPSSPAQRDWRSGWRLVRGSVYRRQTTRSWHYWTRCRSR